MNDSLLTLPTKKFSNYPKIFFEASFVRFLRIGNRLSGDLKRDYLLIDKQIPLNVTSPIACNTLITQSNKIKEKRLLSKKGDLLGKPWFSYECN